jgi:hypothetical protein
MILWRNRGEKNESLICSQRGVIVAILDESSLQRGVIYGGL